MIKIEYSRQIYHILLSGGGERGGGGGRERDRQTETERERNRDMDKDRFSKYGYSEEDPVSSNYEIVDWFDCTDSNVFSTKLAP